MSASRPCSTVWSARSSRWSTTSPGVTRDRREGEARLGDLEFRIIDTAGLEEATEGLLLRRMRAQTEAAIGDADVILFVIDARVGILPADRPFAELVRRSGKPVILIANKAEGNAGMAGRLRRLLARPRRSGPVFGRTRRRPGPICSRPLMPFFPDPTDDAEPARRGSRTEFEDKPLQVAIVGRPNAGKSTLINRMLGEDRLLTGPEAGITRDSISLDWRWRGREIKLFDTAGLRKRARVEDKLEKLSVADALRAVRFAEVVVILLDATIPFEKQDLSIVDLVETRRARPGDRRQQMGSGGRPAGPAEGTEGEGDPAAAAGARRAGRAALGPGRHAASIRS